MLLDQWFGPAIFWKHRAIQSKAMCCSKITSQPIFLKSNGRKSARKWLHHLNIHFFFIADQKEKQKISIQFCPTNKIIGNFLTKPLHRKKFKDFCQTIMNLPSI